MPFDPNQPYNDLPDLPPFVELETKEVLKACIGAHRALARLNSEASKLPNPDLLINPFVLLEAKASSEIENIVTTDDELFKQAVLDEASADPATKEALRYRRALFEGYLSLRNRPLSTATAVQVCRTIKAAEIDIRRIPGTALRNTATGQVIYTPPVGEDVIRQKMANWERFIHEETRLDPFVRMAVQHYQFEAIHPFLDGNGRTGRVLNILFLVQAKLVDLPILYISRELLEHKEAYYMGLRSVTECGAWHEWIGLMLLATNMSANQTLIIVKAIEVVMLATRGHARQSDASLPIDDLLQVIFRNPYVRIADIVESGVAKRQTASDYLHRLVRLGVLEEQKAGREKIFFNPRLLKVLTGRQSEVLGFTPDPAGSPRLLFPDDPIARTA